jgi:signal transduction histidine kinase
VFATVLVLVPGAIYGTITVANSRSTVSRLVGRQLVAEARNGADRLASALRSEQAQLQSFASQDVMREIRVGDFDKRISSFLMSVKRGCPACVDLLVLDQRDHVVAASGAAWIGKRTEISDGAAGTIEGPLAAGSTPSILRFVVTVPDPEAAQSTLARAENPWQRGRLLDARVLDVSGPGSTAHIGSAAGMLFGEARLPDGLPRWRIVVTQPLAEAFAPVRRTATRLAMALVATLLAALAIALVAARRMTRPLAELTAAADLVRCRRGPVPTVRLRSSDEIGTLAAAFNRMSLDLRQAEQELVDAAKFAFVGELAAGVAHEVRTPLGVLRSSTQLLERSLEAKDGEVRELLHLLRAEVDRIERVVSELLELGRPRELKREPIALGEVIFRAVDFVTAQANEKGVVVSRRKSDSDPDVLCDPDLVYQVALNLLVNAVQILPAGGSVQIGLVTPREGYGGFLVRDDGPGMTEEIRARIFEPFFTRRDGGAGLGLTFVQRVVQEHAGRLSVDSAPGRGAVFTVELPLVERMA